MTEFTKGYNVKIVSMIVTMIFFINSTVYGIELPQRSFLRIPVGLKNTFQRMVQAVQVRDDSHEESFDDLDLLITKNVRLEVFFDWVQNRIIRHEDALISPEVDDNYTIHPTAYALDALHTSVGLLEDMGYSLPGLIREREIAVIGPGADLGEAREFLRRVPDVRTIHVVELNNDSFQSIVQEWMTLPSHERLRIKLHRADCRYMPFSDGQLAMVYSAGIGTDVLGIEGTTRLLKEINRALIVKGIVIGNIMTANIPNITKVLDGIGFDTKEGLILFTSSLCCAQKLALNHTAELGNLVKQTPDDILREIESSNDENEIITLMGELRKATYGSIEDTDLYLNKAQRHLSELRIEKRKAKGLAAILAEIPAVAAKIIAIDFGGTLVPTNTNIIAIDDFLLGCLEAMDLLLFTDDELNIHIVSGGRATKEKIEQIIELFPSSFHMLRDSGRFKVSERITDKGQRLKEILQEANLPETSIIAIGDDEETDRPMALKEGYFVRVYPHTRSISPNALDVLGYILEVKSKLIRKELYPMLEINRSL